MAYKGIIIEESLSNTSILQQLTIVSTQVLPTTAADSTPWIKQWTLHTVEFPESKADDIAKALANAIDKAHANAWYADFSNAATHYIIFSQQVFKLNRGNLSGYDEAKTYGLKLGIPAHQLDFKPAELS